jgi:hypothetical protein
MRVCSKDNPRWHNVIFYLKDGGIMTDLHELNKDTPAKEKDTAGSASNDSAQTHRRLEHEADKLANRGNERQRNEDQGEFSNIAPV